MGKISRCEKKILIQEAQQYKTYPSKTKLRKMNRNQLRKRETRERLKYEITGNYENKERIIVWIKDKEKNKEIIEKTRKILEEKYREKELIKDSEKQVKEERYKPEYRITEFNEMIEYRCIICNSNRNGHRCVWKREGEVIGCYDETRKENCLNKNY